MDNAREAERAAMIAHQVYRGTPQGAREFAARCMNLRARLAAVRAGEVVELERLMNVPAALRWGGEGAR